MKKVIKSIFALSVIATMASCSNMEKKEMKDEVMEDKKMEMKEEMAMKEKTMMVKTADSKVMWSGSILGAFSKEGTLDITEGSLELMGDKIVGGKFMVDMTTITPTGDDFNEENTPEMLAGHLSSGDFFLVDSFPTATFVIKSADMDANTITGDLTIRGITKEETVGDVSIDMESNTANGSLIFNRQDYDVSFVNPAKNAVISDDIELAISLKM